MEFNSAVCVREWLAQPSNREQERVDKIVSLVKAGAIPLVQPPRAGSEPSIPAAAQIAEDLEQVRKILDDLGDELSGDDDTLARHALKLQNLDIMSQMLGAIAKHLDGSAGSEGAARLEDLRRSCAEALK